jgi:peroxiredoxin
MVRTLSTMLPLGTEAPDFSLGDTDGKTVSRSDFKGKKGLLVIFMCNHCPYVKHVADELKRLSDEYLVKGVGVVAISSNDAVAYPDDSPEKMKEEKAMRGYAFPYLFDETQKVAKAYHAACTPDFFLFDADHKLVYRGQMDDSRPKTDRPVTGADLRAALDALLAGQPPLATQTPSLGCNIKWMEGSEPSYFNPA